MNNQKLFDTLQSIYGSPPTDEIMSEIKSAIIEDELADFENSMRQAESELDEGEDFDEDEIHFEECGDCDCPDACMDFGCAVKQGIRQISIP